MKILYFGTVCDMGKYNEILNGCKYKPSVASVVFETALLDGFRENNIELEIHSFPMIPTFPKSSLLHFGNNIEKLNSGYECHWLNTVNVPVLKQLSRRVDARKRIKHWLREHGKEGIIITYSIPPFLVKDILKYSKKYFVKTVAIIPDLLRDMYINENSSVLLRRLKTFYLKPALQVQDKYSAYVYLTEAMHKIVAPQKPYIVMEGIASVPPVFKQKIEKSVPRGIMYAGMLHERYGIINLLDAFEKADIENTELWLFGEGTAVEQIKVRAKNNNSIKYYGTVSHNEILEYERKASLLVNPRDPKEEFTFYSFPSKMIEYMLSGTPLLTTKLKGIPSDYFKFVFETEDNNVDNLVNALSLALGYSDDDLKKIGEEAKKFILEEKNAKKQVKRIINFIKEVTQ